MPSPTPGPAPWPLISTQPGPDLLVARARFDTLENPRTGERMRRLVLDTRDWVNVAALTPVGELVLVRQFRFGNGVVTTEIPGGVVDPGEEPLEAAKRELREETGHTSADWSLLGAVEPNPAFLNNVCYHYLACDARRTHETEFDPGEDIQVVTLPAEEVQSALLDGTIRHSLVVSALCRLFDLRGGTLRDAPSDPA